MLGANSTGFAVADAFFRKALRRGGISARTSGGFDFLINLTICKRSAGTYSLFDDRSAVWGDARGKDVAGSVTLDGVRCGDVGADHAVGLLFGEILPGDG